MRKRAQEARENPEALLSSRVRRTTCKSMRRCRAASASGRPSALAWSKRAWMSARRKASSALGYVPKGPSDDVHGQFQGPLRVLPMRRGELYLTCRTKDGGGSGVGRVDGHQGRQPDQRDRTERNRRGQGAQDEAPRDRARPLYHHPRASGQCAVSLVDDWPFQRPDRGRCRRQLLHWQATGHDESRRKAVQRGVHAQDRHRNPVLRQTPSGTDGMAAKPTTWIDKGVLKTLAYDRAWAKRQKKDATPSSINQSAGDGWLGHVGRADDQNDQAWPAGDVLGTSAPSIRRRCSTPA